MMHLSLTLCKKTLKPSQENVSLPRMDEKKLHTQEFQLKGSGRNMRLSYFKKGLLEKQRVFQTLGPYCL